MLRNYFTIAFRNLVRQKAYSLINILGLAIGLMACLFIMLYIFDEYKYDKHHSKGDQIYRLIIEYKDQAGDIFAMPLQSYRLREALQIEFPEMKRITRITYPYNAGFEYGDKKQRLMVSAVDSDYFDMFDLEMIKGDKNTALNGPDVLMISESSAEKLFGEEDPVGKVIEMFTNAGDFPVRITGVYKDFPRTSHFHLDGIFSTIATDNIYNEREKTSWGEGTCLVYALIPDPGNVQGIESRFPSFVEKARGQGASEDVDYSLQPLHDIHLKSNLRFELEANGDIRYIYIFGIIALFILAIATVNYMNLSTARSIRRSREVGVRKVTGANRNQLIFQFLGEAVVYSFISMWLALLLAEVFLPFFNNLSGKELKIEILNNWKLLIILLLSSVFVGVLAGTYPAFFLSRYKPVSVLSGAPVKAGSQNFNLRKILVVLQFTISITLIISTLIIFSQWSFMRNARLGINPENVIIIPTPSDDFRTFKQEILKNPGVISVSALNKKPTRELSSNLGFQAEGVEINEDASIKIVTVDWDFFETIGNKIVKGRSFDRQFGSDEKDAFILNEAAVDYIGWDDPIGKWFETWTLDSAGINFIKRKGTVIGVAENFYFESLHNQIRPVVYFIQENWINWMVIRISGQDMQKTISGIRETWDQFNGDEDFRFSFYEDDIQNLYINEGRIFRIFITFAILAIFIASLGVLGLVSFTSEQRTKEIGIRKTMGASTARIIKLLTVDFMILVLLANLIAWPIAWYIMKGWLQDFPQRIDLEPWYFVVSSLMAVFIALLTTFYQAWRAASANPAESLKYE